MEKINKTEDTKFVVKENRKGKRRVITSGQSVFKLLQSYFYGNVICAGEKNKTLETKFQDFFTLDKSVVKGTLDVSYTVNNCLDYAKERNTEKILDVITRTVLSEYFENINLGELPTPYKMSEDMRQTFIAILNERVSKILPWITVNNTSDIIISNSQKYEDKFTFRLNKNINKKEKELSMDAEYYKPTTVNVADDIYSKQFYPDKRFIAKDQMLYYCGGLRKPGIYHNKKAQGDIVNLGLHVLSTRPYVVQAPDADKFENKLAVYPNIIYEVTDLRKHYSEYMCATNLLNGLSDYISGLLDYDQDHKNLKNNVIHIDDAVKELNDDYLNEMLRELREDYAVDVKVILYSQKNPCVKKTEYVKTPEELFKGFLNPVQSHQRVKNK